MASSKLTKTPAPSAVAMKPTTTETVSAPEETTTVEETKATEPNPIAVLIASPTPFLKQLLAAVRLELKVRDEAVQAKRPAEGTKVKISAEAPKRWAGRTGTVLLANKTRVFIKVDGFIQAAIVPLTQIETL